jgi:septation ring formation regulator EzrA
MKTYLFEGKGELSSRDILDNLESDNCGVEECHTFVKRFSENELVKAESDYLESSKQLDALERELEAISSPIKEKMKPLKKTSKDLIQALNKGGLEVTEKVFCFPDYENKIMGLYDQRGYLVGTRPMTRSERQFHINSHLNTAL